MWRGRLVVGLAAIALLALVLVAAAVGWALTVAGEPARLLVWQGAVLAWLVAVIWAGAWWWLCERDGPDDPAIYNDCARSAQAALLRGEGERAWSMRSASSVAPRAVPRPGNCSRTVPRLLATIA